MEQQPRCPVRRLQMRRLQLSKPWTAIFILLALSALAQSIDPMPVARSADSYAIYSLLMPGNPFASMPPEQNKRWAIADATIGIADMNPAIPPEGQLKAPPENVNAFREAVHDFNLRKNGRIQLTPHFQLSHDYTLMTATQVNEFRHARGSVHANSDLKDKYAGYPGITFFSQVYFNDAQTAALVYMNNWCANLCSAGTWVYLEKHGGQWVRRSGITTRMQ